MSDTTESLLLRRALGRACPEDYVSWAVDQLCREADSASLRVLAGLSVRFDRDEIEAYFRRSCGELGLVEVDEGTPPLEVARMVQRAYAGRRVSADEAVEMMAQIHSSHEYQEELLEPWYNMREELAWGDGYYYPSVKLASVEDAVRVEWSLLDRATQLGLPPGWMRLSRCADCAHVGATRVVEPSFVARVLARLRREPAWSRAACEKCGSGQLTNLCNPDARAAFLDEVESRGWPAALVR
jgi:hypothetical protein